MKAASSGSTEIINILLENGANAHVVDKRGLTADGYAEITFKELGIHEVLRKWMQENPPN